MRLSPPASKVGRSITCAAGVNRQSWQQGDFLVGEESQMLNSELKQKALKQLEKAVKKHERTRLSVQQASVELFEQRQHAAGEVIDAVELYVNRLANSPKDFKKRVAEYRVEVSRFDDTVREIEIEAANTKKIGSAAGAAGTAAGVGVAALGPTAAMAVATTFGAASTGTAISALSGAAATNAALAWLGGGALAAGGGGMVAGNAFLGLAGPVGWTIGGVAIAGSAIYLQQQNAKFAEEATEQRISVEAELRSLKTAGREISGLSCQTRQISDACLSDLEWLTEKAPRDYLSFSNAEKERLGTLVNHIRALGELISAEVAL